jgi:hypothetical protein
LRLTPSAVGAGTVRVRPVANTSWTEAGLTHSNAPAAVGTGREPHGHRHRRTDGRPHRVDARSGDLRVRDHRRRGGRTGTSGPPKPRRWPDPEPDGRSHGVHARLPRRSPCAPTGCTTAPRFRAVTRRS